MTVPDLPAERLQALLPEAFSESKIEFEKLCAALVSLSRFEEAAPWGVTKPFDHEFNLLKYY